MPTIRDSNLPNPRGIQGMIFATGVISVVIAVVTVSKMIDAREGRVTHAIRRRVTKKLRECGHAMEQAKEYLRTGDSVLAYTHASHADENIRCCREIIGEAIGHIAMIDVDTMEADLNELLRSIPPLTKEHFYDRQDPQYDESSNPPLNTSTPLPKYTYLPNNNKNTQ